jgi:hypothetical protein
MILITNDVESHHILYEGQYGVCCGRSAMDAAGVLLATIEEIWEKKKIAAALMMDVKGAFPTVNCACLLYKIHQTRMDENLVQWTDSFMSNHRVEIIMNGEPELAIETNTGLPQGSPVSPVLFLIYIADLAALIEKEVDSTVGLSFVDDVTWIIDGTTVEEVTEQLNKCTAKTLTWVEQNAVRFEEDKTEAILFSKCQEHQTDIDMKVWVSHHDIAYNRQATHWLGVWLDSKLTLSQHHHKWITKAKQQQAQIARLCRHWGLPLSSAANLQKAVVQSVATYGIELGTIQKNPPHDKTRLANLQKVLNQQARAATGCFRTTPIGFLIAEGGSRPATAIVRGRQERFKARILARPTPPVPIGRRNISATAEAIRRLYKCYVDQTGLGTVETTRPCLTSKTKGTIIIEPAVQAEESAWQWEDLKAECFWTDGSQLPNRYTGAAVVRHADGQFGAEEFYLGTNKEVFDAELYVIQRALHSA